MRKITYRVGTREGAICWVASEDFSELEGRQFRLNSTKAVDITKDDTLSEMSKILLSAVAGATIQHLLDLHISSNEIFSIGEIEI